MGLSHEQHQYIDVKNITPLAVTHTGIGRLQNDSAYMKNKQNEHGYHVKFSLELRQNIAFIRVVLSQNTTER